MKTPDFLAISTGSIVGSVTPLASELQSAACSAAAAIAVYLVKSLFDLLIKKLKK